MFDLDLTIGLIHVFTQQTCTFAIETPESDANWKELSSFILNISNFSATKAN